MTNGRIINPTAAKIVVENHPGPLAQPVSITAKTPQGVQIITAGGLTKLEHGALLVAAGSMGSLIGSEPCDIPADMAERVVLIAESVLNECAERQKPTGGSEN